MAFGLLAWIRRVPVGLVTVSGGFFSGSLFKGPLVELSFGQAEEDVAVLPQELLELAR